MMDQLGKWTYELFNKPIAKPITAPTQYTGETNMADNFDRALRLVLKHEGGYVNHPSDPGGMTNLGITRKVYESWVGRTVNESEMKALTVGDATPIYLEKYWNRLNCSQLPVGLDLIVFDFGVNAGVKRSAKFLQTLVGANPDGDIGPVTLKLVEEYVARNGIRMAINYFSDDRRKYYRSLSTFPTFGKGWLRRTDEIEHQANAWTLDR